MGRQKHDQGGSTWVKLAADGDKAVVVFLGEPFPREVCFVDGKYLPFDEKLKAQGLKPSLRVAFNVALYDTKEVKVLEQGVVFFKDLVRVREARIVVVAVAFPTALRVSERPAGWLPCQARMPASRQTAETTQGSAVGRFFFLGLDFVWTVRQESLGKGEVM